MAGKGVEVAEACEEEGCERRGLREMNAGEEQGRGA